MIRKLASKIAPAPAGMGALVLPVFLLVGLDAPRAAVTESDFHMRTARDLISLCSASQSDPLATAAANFCEGFVVGVYQTLSEQQAATRRKLFCAPQTVPTRTQAIADFMTWANANPSVMPERPADAIARYLASKFPCPAR